MASKSKSKSTKASLTAAEESEEVSPEEAALTESDPRTEEQVALGDEAEEQILDELPEVPNPPKSAALVDATLRRPREAGDVDAATGVFHKSSNLGSISDKTMEKRSEEIEEQKAKSSAKSKGKIEDPAPNDLES